MTVPKQTITVWLNGSEDDDVPLEVEAHVIDDEYAIWSEGDHINLAIKESYSGDWVLAREIPKTQIDPIIEALSFSMV